MRRRHESRRCHFPAFGRGLSLRRRNDRGVMHQLEDFPAFGRGLSLRLLWGTCLILDGVSFPRLRAGTFIEADLVEAENVLGSRISPPSGGDFH